MTTLLTTAPPITRTQPHPVAGQPPRGCLCLYFLGILPSWFVIHVWYKAVLLAEGASWRLSDELVCFIGAFFWPLVLPALLFLIFLLWTTKPGL